MLHYEGILYNEEDCWNNESQRKFVRKWRNEDCHNCKQIGYLFFGFDDGLEVLYLVLLLHVFHLFALESLYDRQAHAYADD